MYVYTCTSMTQRGSGWHGAHTHGVSFSLLRGDERELNRSILVYMIHVYHVTVYLVARLAHTYVDVSITLVYTQSAMHTSHIQTCETQRNKQSHTRGNGSSHNLCVL